MRAYDRAYLKRPYVARRRLNSRLLRMFGMTVEDHEGIFKAQGRACALCGGPTHKDRNGNPCWHTDHDHKTKRFRGILCGWCNKGLGNFKDDPELLGRAIRYLRDPK
jgi:Recombination endonuclease VII